MSLITRLIFAHSNAAKTLLGNQMREIYLMLRFEEKSESFFVWLDFANEDQEGCCLRRLQARSWLSRPMRDKQVLVQCRHM